MRIGAEIARRTRANRRRSNHVGALDARSDELYLRDPGQYVAEVVNPPSASGEERRSRWDIRGWTNESTHAHPAAARDVASLTSCDVAGPNKEEEERRVEKELANVRAHFTAARLSEYDRRKYVWKMVYISMLGYDIDFGLNEVLNLVQFPSYPDKVVGYMAATILMTASSEQMSGVKRAMMADMRSSDPMTQALALTAAANFGGKLLADDLGETVRAVFFAASTSPPVRMKAGLVLLRLFRVKPDLLTAKEHGIKLADLLGEEQFGVRQSVMQLILGVLSKHGIVGFPAVQARAATMLASITSRKTCPPEYVYHGAIAPWYQVNLLRILRLFPFPTDEGVSYEMKTALNNILVSTMSNRSVNRNNAEHAVLFEAIDVIIHHGEQAPRELRDKATEHLARFVNIREPNIRYLGLEAMTRMSHLPGTRDVVLRQQKAVFISLKERDISLRRRALDLLFATCGKDNAVEIVEELLRNLVTADDAIREEMVLKIAILAERYATNLRWYVDTVLQLIALAGDQVSDDIWHRAVQIITNNPPLQRYAAMKVFRAAESTEVHLMAVKVAAYILGEFGFLLQEPAAPTDAEAAGATEEEEDEAAAAARAEEDATIISGSQQFAALHQHFERVPPSSRTLLLSSYAKLLHLYRQELEGAIVPIFEAHSSVLDQELQQRAVEYLALRHQDEEIKDKVLEAMPAFADRQSALEARLANAGKGTQGDGWEAKEGDEDGAAAPASGDAAAAAAGRAAASGSAKSSSGAGADERPPAAGESDDEGDSGAAPDAEEEDFLGLGSAAPRAAAPAPAPTRAAVAPPAEDDVLDLMGGAAAVAAPRAPAEPVIVNKVGITPAQAPALKSMLYRLLTAKKSKLFEDESVQIGVVTELRGSTGVVRLFLGNRTPAPLTRVAVEIGDSPSVEVSVQSHADTVQPGKQEQIEIRARCMQPFSDLIPMKLTFISGADMSHATAHSYPLRLPIFATSFCEPVEMTTEVLQQRWGSLADEGRAATAQIPNDAASSATLATVLRALNAGIVSESPKGCLAAGSFRTETVNAQGRNVSVGCLFRIGATGGEYKVEVRTQHATVTKALINALNIALAPAA